MRSELSYAGEQCSGKWLPFWSIWSELGVRESGRRLADYLSERRRWMPLSQNDEARGCSVVERIFTRK